MVSFITPSEPGSNVNVSQGVSIYVTVRGTEKNSWDIGDISVESSSPNLRVAVVVGDTGNVHIRPRGTVEILDEHKEIAGRLTLQYGQPVYPGQKRTYETLGPVSALKPGKYRITAVVTCGDEVKRKNG